MGGGAQGEGERQGGVQAGERQRCLTTDPGDSLGSPLLPWQVRPGSVQGGARPQSVARVGNTFSRVPDPEARWGTGHSGGILLPQDWTKLFW